MEGDQDAGQSAREERGPEVRCLDGDALGPAGQEAFGIRMEINRFDALDGATTFQKRTHRIIQLLMRAGSSTFDFESSEGVLVKVGHGVNSGYNSYVGPKPRAEEREGWDGSSIPRIWARRA